MVADSLYLGFRGLGWFRDLLYFLVSTPCLFCFGGFRSDFITDSEFQGGLYLEFRVVGWLYLEVRVSRVIVFRF